MEVLVNNHETMFDQNQVQQFQSFEFPNSWKIKNDWWTTYDLTDLPIYIEIKKIRDIISEFIDKYQEDIKGNQILVSSITNVISQFVNWKSQLDQIKNIDDANAVNIKNQIINSATDIINRINSRNDQSYNILWSYDTLRLNAIIDQSWQKNADQLIKDLKVAIEEVEQLKQKIETTAVKIEVSKFSEIFHNEAKKYDSTNNKKRYCLLKFREWWRSQIFLSLGLITAIWLLLYLLFFDFSQYIILDPNNSINLWQTLAITIPHLLILSIWVYIVSFCFKQYNIAQHLAVQNKHRANALDSFDGFLVSIWDDHSDIKSTLTLEVAKSIYNQWNTWHLQSWNDSVVSPWIVEITKMISTTTK